MAHAIDTPGSIDGTFTEGNPATGQRATKVGSDWLNDWQSNLLGVLAEGGVNPTKMRDADLIDAIKAVIAGIVGTGGASVPTTRALTGGGLVSGGGDLSADRTFTVAKASAAEIDAGTEDAKAITPLGLRQSATAGLTQNGYAKLPGGLIIQWGQVRGTFDESTNYKAFSIPFPNGCFSVAVTAANTSGSSDVDLWCQVVSRGTAGFTAMFQKGHAGGSNCQGYDFIAIGW